MNHIKVKISFNLLFENIYKETEKLNDTQIDEIRNNVKTIIDNTIDMFNVNKEGVYHEIEKLHISNIKLTNKIKTCKLKVYFPKEDNEHYPTLVEDNKWFYSQEDARTYFDNTYGASIYSGIIYVFHNEVMINEIEIGVSSG